jgi:hypothetical protein
MASLRAPAKQTHATPLRRVEGRKKHSGKMLSKALHIPELVKLLLGVALLLED